MRKKKQTNEKETSNKNRNSGTNEAEKYMPPSGPHTMNRIRCFIGYCALFPPQKHIEFSVHDHGGITNHITDL